MCYHVIHHVIHHVIIYQSVLIKRISSQYFVCSDNLHIICMGKHAKCILCPILPIWQLKSSSI